MSSGDLRPAGGCDARGGLSSAARLGSASTTGAAPEEGLMLYVFEDYTLDTRRYELRRAGDLVPLDRQVFEVLAYLLAHPDQVVTRQELFTHLWPERFVSDAALERCITVARRALGDNGREPRCIKTVHGRGYRFVAAVAIA